MRRFVADGRAGVALLVALVFPILVGFSMLGIDGAYMYYRNLMLRQTVQAAALAGGNVIASYYTSGTNSSATVVSRAQQFATANMPVATYGTVVNSSDVVLGNWNTATSTFTSLAASNGTSPNAVSVTGRNASSSSNPVSLFLGNMYARPTMDMTTTAITSYATGQSWHTIVINDLSGSFSPSIARQREADQAILDCVKNSTGPLSNFSIVGITGHYTVWQALVQASTNYAAVSSRISALNSCGGTGAPSCSGSNVASGIYRATKSDMFGSSAYVGAAKNIIIITDGVPNANSFTYTREDGIYPSPSSTTATCTSACTDANLLTMAQNQATYANSLGISISTIYYSGGTPSNQQASYAASLATLRRGTGISLVAPSSGQISSTFAAFCATMSSKLMAVR
jgi:Flp pilus assembly protein TadG